MIRMLFFGIADVDFIGPEIVFACTEIFCKTKYLKHIIFQLIKKKYNNKTSYDKSRSVLFLYAYHETDYHLFLRTEVFTTQGK